MIKAVAFDYGNTLVFSPFPLDWQSSYAEVVAEILESIGLEAGPDKIQTGKETLLKYNTRANPREHEVYADDIFREMFAAWGVGDTGKIRTAKDTFASFFMKQSEPYADSLPVLKVLRKRGLKTGVLSNTAYGLDREYLVRDTEELAGYVDVFLSSTDVGFRKPSTKGFYQLADELDVSPAECIFVGDEVVDITGANASGMVSVLVERSGRDLQYGQVYTIKALGEILDLI